MTILYRSCFRYGKVGHQVRYQPTREVKQVPPNAPKGYDPKKNRFFALPTKGAKQNEGDDDGGNLVYLSLQCYKFIVSWGVWLVDGLHDHGRVFHVHGV